MALQIAPMKLVPEIRLLNLEKLVGELGTLDAVAERGGTSSVYLSQLRNGAVDAKTGKTREMGPAMARRLEVGCHKPRGWMDVEHHDGDGERRGRPNQRREADARDKVLEMFPVLTPGGSTDELIHGKNGDRRLVGKVALAVMDVKASMGHGAVQPSHDNIVMSMVVDETWLRRHATFSSPDQLALVTGIGDSMFPTFEDGDPLLVDRGVTDIKLDAVYVLSLNDELYIKRVQRRPDGTVVMISDNKSYEPYHIKGNERNRFQVLGRVVMVWNAKRI